ncbi:MAG: FtsQ-type POTRA domain-containing protein, partial [Holosporaceae bacterium]|nr:FtsQ-type POTRA domain-containing protein [Holosporaceae bacterium]
MLRYFNYVFRSNFFLLLVFIGVISGGVYFYWDKIIKSPNADFCIKKIEFDGNERVQDVLLLKTSGLKYRSNIFAPSIHEVKRRLENIAW